MIKLKLGNKASQVPRDGEPLQPRPPVPAPSPSNSAPTASGGFKLKLNVSQPPTPIEQPAQVSFPSLTAGEPDRKKRAPKKTDGPAKGKKRPAEDDNSPVAKRILSGAGPRRKISLKIPLAHGGGDGPGPAKLALKRKQSVPKILDIRARGKVPPRPKGVGYDSEDSDTERDPAIQQALVLRMEPGEDADYLREAIAAGKIGPSPSSGDAEISLKFIERNCRRAVINIRGTTYAAALVDLPCVVESMKSFDRKSWWKVADIAQMLLVLGRCNSEEEAKAMPLPREINKDNLQYAHGLTPPMHWARKRRFRKRLNYNETLNVEEEVKRLLEEDHIRTNAGGKVENQRLDGRDLRQQSEQRSEVDYEEDAEGEEAMDTIEGQETYDFSGLEAEADGNGDEDDGQLEAEMLAMFEENNDGAQLVSDSPAPIADEAGSMDVIENAMPEEATPIGTPIGESGNITQDERSDEEEEEEEEESEDDEDSPDVVDEDAVAKQVERAQQMEEVQDLEKEVERARLKVNAMTNQLLRQREMQRLTALEEELTTKKRVFGFEDDD